ncbi:hypothetical protein ACFPRL_01450 [Pseudoclavibacter helvolus]
MSRNTMRLVNWVLCRVDSLGRRGPAVQARRWSVHAGSVGWRLNRCAPSL